MTKEKAREKIKKLVEEYEELKQGDSLKDKNEAFTKQRFIQPLFEALGWDFENDVWPETDVSGKRVDYAFKLDGTTRFYMEAKALSVNLEEDRWAEQAIGYAWHKNVPWVILTDFETIKVFNTEWDEPNIQSCRFIELNYKDYLVSEKLWWLSKTDFQSGILDKVALEYGRKPKKVIDIQLAEDLVRWREEMLKELAGYNSKIEKHKIAIYVQTILNRLIFIRKLEDSKIEEPILLPVVRNWKEKKTIKANLLLKSLNKIFHQIAKDYDSGLFEVGPCDFLGEKLEADDNLFADIIEELYHSKSGARYNFDDIPADIYGSIYEQYLSEVQKDGEEKKSGKRKSQGIYYTPRYIVDYIVKNTIGELMRTEHSEKIKTLKILDPACGSGSFLIAAYQQILEYYQKEKDKKLSKADKIAKGFARKKGNELSPVDKERILLKHIYGMDLDEEAVELARLNLLMKMVGKRMKLPNLDSNIQNGNSLISGSDIELKKYFGNNWKDKKPFNWGKNSGFNVIIGNPPYVRVDSLSIEDKNYWKKIYSSSQGKYDLYYLFIEESLKLLNEGGILGFIIPNKFCVASSAKKLREIIFKHSKKCEFYSVSKINVFSSASNYPVILFVTKGSDLENINIRYYKHEADIVRKNYIGYTLKRNDLNDFPSKIIPINIDERQYNLVRKLLKNEKLSSYLKISEGLRIPSNLEKNTKDNYGIVKQYQFERYSGIKEGSYIQEKDFKKVISKKSERYKNILKDKILIAEDSLCITSTFDANKNIPQGGVYFGVAIKKEINLKYFLALLNSKLLSKVYEILFGGMHMGGGYLRYRTEFLNELPIIVNIKLQKNMVDLVENIMILNRELQKLDPIMDDKEYDEIKNEIEKTDKEIDRKVYELYGLTGEEVKIVEGK